MVHLPSDLGFRLSPIHFGTDGWRGVIAADFTFERVAQVAAVSAQVLQRVYGATAKRPLVMVGYDRRFLSETFARTAAAAARMTGVEVLLAETDAPTPALSWAAQHYGALGALVITASHNPAPYSGLKIKGAFGGSVPPEVTHQVEVGLQEAPIRDWQGCSTVDLPTFDPWTDYCAALRAKVDIEAIRTAIAQGQLTVFADAMHGSAASGLSRILEMTIDEVNGERDPLFANGAPEPLPRYLTKTLQKIATDPRRGKIGLVFDGDGDRIAAIDGQGQFLSSQALIPVLIDHLADRIHPAGEVIKTISGSDLIPRVAALRGLSVYETAVGYKYIADRMLAVTAAGGVPPLLGGEESGGIGYGTHIPERDALLSALYVLEACAQSGLDPSDRYRLLQDKVGFRSTYDRIDLPLGSMEVRDRLVQELQTPLTTVAGERVTDCLAIDGYKFRLADGSWLLVRFSGTEPLLRLYCEAQTPDRVGAVLAWAKDWANSI